MRRTAILCLLLALYAPVQAGLHYSGESYAELPSRWRGFLLDQRALRQIAVTPTAAQPATSLRQQYEQEASRLAQLSRQRPLTADEAADLGALHLRLGDVARAVDVLRAAQRQHPIHFRLAANLGTAWQMQGDLVQAAAVLEQAVRLAPGKFVRAEQLHLQLVRQRRRQLSQNPYLDDLLGVSFVGPSDKYEPGRLHPTQQKSLPANAIALVQQLALWLPADSRLLWLLAELANVHGDVITAAAIMDGCVTEFGLRSPELLEHRRILRAAADAVTGKKPEDKHEEHALSLKPRSSRPLLSKFSLADLPPVDPKKVNTLAWEVLTETTVDRRSRPTFARYLRELDGLQVEMRGHMQPLAEDTDLGAFMLLEHPVGCWYCEKPDMIAIVLVELPEGKSGSFTRDPIRVTGKLLLNATNPETFFYILRDARVQ